MLGLVFGAGDCLAVKLDSDKAGSLETCEVLPERFSCEKTRKTTTNAMTCAIATIKRIML